MGDSFDVIVVGAGPAGSRAAEAAAKGGAKVLLIDKRKEVGVPVQCAEFLHGKVVSELGLPEDVVIQSISGMLTFVRGVEHGRMRSPGSILDRAAFDKLLVDRAMEAGVELRTGTRALEPLMIDGRIEGAVLEDDDCGSDVRASTVIGADGPTSTVGAWVGGCNEDMLIANQATVELKETSDMTEVYLDPKFPGGYGWLFPRGGLANVGVGVDPSFGIGPRVALDGLLELVKDKVGKVVDRTGGHIPVNGPFEPPVGKVMLVGDAGGFTHPITGGGIHQAVATGAFAGKASAEGRPEDFVDRWQVLFGRSLAHARERRKLMIGSWEEAIKDEDGFIDLMRRCWIGFKEYYR